MKEKQRFFERQFMMLLGALMLLGTAAFNKAGLWPTLIYSLCVVICLINLRLQFKWLNGMSAIIAFIGFMSMITSMAGKG